MIDAAEILAIEQRALNAWPALESATVDGWSLRAAGGWTKRSNSANPLAPSGTFEAVRSEVCAAADTSSGGRKRLSSAR